MIIWDWKFVKENSMIEWENKASDEKKTDDINEEHFKFKLIRIKDTDTKKEVLRIEAFLNDTENGNVITSMNKLDEALLSFREYGIIFSDDNSRLKLKRKIEQVYMSIKDEKIRSLNEPEISKFDSFMEALGEYINALKEPFSEDGLCYIPVAEFDQIALDCEYREYEIQGLRKKLKDNKYIRTVGDRYAILVRYQGKPTRVIALIKDEIVKNPKIKLSEKEQEA